MFFSASYFRLTKGHNGVFYPIMQVRLDSDVAEEILRLAKQSGRSGRKEVNMQLRHKFWPDEFVDPNIFSISHKKSVNKNK